jgi:hypothetical protein
MSLRFFSLFCLLCLSPASLAQQEAINVPFDETTVAESPIAVAGKISVRETIAANEVNSSWEENVTATNNSTKPILLLVGDLDAIDGSS